MPDRNSFRYDRMVQQALRGVVRDAIAYTAEHGLPGAHHFYITFRTDFPGVDIPDFLSAQYPSDMTIVLEHQFWGLEVDDEKFQVTLSFRGQSYRLVIPLLAIKAFVDPSVKFGLEFPAEDEEQPRASAKPAPLMTLPDAVTDTAPKAADPADSADKTGEVVKLDAFRKK